LKQPDNVVKMTLTLVRGTLLLTWDNGKI
jgi:hypothetical protein